MALDGAFLACLRQELTDTLQEARIDKIHQPAREELVIALRWKGGAEKLYLSAGANAPRLHSLLHFCFYAKNFTIFFGHRLLQALLLSYDSCLLLRLFDLLDGL